MKDRIGIIMKEEGLSSAKFAKEINVQPSSISHILSGRNNPSTDFIINVLNRFVWVNPEWLLLGKGNKYKTNNDNVNSNPDTAHQKITTPYQASLFPDEISNEIPALLNNSPKEELKQQNVSTSEDLQNDNQSSSDRNSKVSDKNNSKEIDKIVIFYVDKTFELYNSK